MPNLDGEFGIIRDEEVTTATVALAIALLATLRLEELGLIKSKGRVHRDGLLGLYHRSVRLGIQRPRLTEILRASSTLSCDYDYLRLMAGIGIPETLKGPL